MELKNQVCTFEQAKRLKELGVCQESAFYFVGTSEKDISPNSIKVGSGYEWSDYPGYGLYPIQYSAFTVAELGIMMDNANVEKSKTYKGEWFVHIAPPGKEYYPTEAQARAQKLIISIEREYVTLDEINQCLKAV
jgi:hypothetical protein